MIESLTVACHIDGQCLGALLARSVLEGDVLGIEVGGIDAHGRCLVECVARSHSLRRGNHRAVATFADNRQPLCGALALRTDVHVLDIGAVLDEDCGLGIVGSRIHGSLYGGIVAVATGIDGYCVLGAGTCHEPQHQTDAENLVIHVATILVLRNDAQDGIL